MWLKRREKDQRRCAIGLGPEDQQAMEGEGLLIMGVLGLDRSPDHAHHLITLVLEVDIARGLIHLLQEGKVITLFPLGGQQSILDHQEVLQWSEMVIKSVGLILLLMAMVLNRTKAMDMLRNLCTSLRLIEVGGSHPQVENRDHLWDLDQDQGLLICHPDVEDEVCRSLAICCWASVLYFMHFTAIFIKTRILLEVCEYAGSWMNV